MCWGRGRARSWAGGQQGELLPILVWHHPGATWGRALQGSQAQPHLGRTVAPAPPGGAARNHSLSPLSAPGSPNPACWKMLEVTLEWLRTVRCLTPFPTVLGSAQTGALGPSAELCTCSAGDPGEEQAVPQAACGLPGQRGPRPPCTQHGPAPPRLSTCSPLPPSGGARKETRWPWCWEVRVGAQGTGSGPRVRGGSEAWGCSRALHPQRRQLLWVMKRRGQTVGSAGHCMSSVLSARGGPWSAGCTTRAGPLPRQAVCARQ